MATEQEKRWAEVVCSECRHKILNTNTIVALCAPCAEAIRKADPGAMSFGDPTPGKGTR